MKPGYKFKGAKARNTIPHTIYVDNYHTLNEVAHWNCYKGDVFRESEYRCSHTIGAWKIKHK